MPLLDQLENLHLMFILSLQNMTFLCLGKLIHTRRHDVDQAMTFNLLLLLFFVIARGSEYNSESAHWDEIRQTVGQNQNIFHFTSTIYDTTPTKISEMNPIIFKWISKYWMCLYISTSKTAAIWRQYNKLTRAPVAVFCIACGKCTLFLTFFSHQDVKRWSGQMTVVCFFV